LATHDEQTRSANGLEKIELVPIEGGLGRAAGAIYVVLAFRENQAAAC
jgi:hypothetical protein